ncbi:MAG: hypothetical protein GY807_04950, partial [Gammaproteobacteria bacterium]|nr:hypothetical protein [Gammaproteobacteria bacterium]
MGKPERDDLDLQARWERAESFKKRPKPWCEWLARGWHEKLGDLSEFAKELNQSTAIYINGRRGKHGHLWGDRFKSVLV